MSTHTQNKLKKRIPKLRYEKVFTISWHHTAQQINGNQWLTKKYSKERKNNYLKIGGLFTNYFC